MEIKTTTIQIETEGHTDIKDITGHVSAVLKESGLREGSVTIFAVGSTAGITTIEYEPGLVRTDIPAVYEKLAPENRHYAHHETWGDDNGSSHVRATLTGPSLVVPFTDSALTLGRWQQIVCIDFDTRPRDRTIVVQVMGVR